MRMLLNYLKGSLQAIVMVLTLVTSLQLYAGEVAGIAWSFQNADFMLEKTKTELYDSRDPRNPWELASVEYDVRIEGVLISLKEGRVMIDAPLNDNTPYVLSSTQRFDDARIAIVVYEESNHYVLNLLIQPLLMQSDKYGQFGILIRLSASSTARGLVVLEKFLKHSMIYNIKLSKFAPLDEGIVAYVKKEVNTVVYDN